MAALSFQSLQLQLNAVKSLLLAAGGKDGVVSRRDLKNLIERETSEELRAFLQLFYHFLIKLENRSGVRVTESVIENACKLIEEQVFPMLEIQTELTEEVRSNIVQVHPSALALTNQLFRLTGNAQGTYGSSMSLSTKEVSAKIAQHTEGPFFDDFGSEASIAITAFYQEASIKHLNPGSFAEALSLKPEDPAEKVERFELADEALMNFVDMNEQFGYGNQARQIRDLMKDHLTQLSIIIIGEDGNSRVASEHPVYVVGVGVDGDLAGFRSTVVWT